MRIDYSPFGPPAEAAGERKQAPAAIPVRSDPVLAEAINVIQELVSRHAPAVEIYDAVLAGGLSLMDGDSGSLRFTEMDNPDWTVAVAWHGSAGKGERWRHRAPLSEGLSGRVISTGEPSALDDYQAAHTGSQLAPAGTQAIIGIPIREQKQVIGSLVVGTTAKGRHWTRRDSALLAAYGEQVNLVVAVARASSTLQEALTDSLTGLANRRLLLERLQHEVVRADRGGEPVTVLFMDIDGFKLVNDSLGHHAGDQLLVAVAQRLRGCVRDGDVCARVGGDEFAVLLTGATDPEMVARRIIESLSKRFPIGTNELFLSGSVGIASGRDEPETLLRHADVAMYHAKRAGTTHYARFEPSMQAALVSRLELDGEVRRAIERDELELHYQPLYDLRSGAIAWFEGLLRWRQPVRGLVAPLDFVPLAEASGIIVEIGRWVLEHGSRQLEDWWREAPIALSLNVSTRELRAPGYTEAVRQAIDRSFPPSALILEVTEREPISEVHGVLETLNAIKALGVRLALDDFGTGYSTLLNLSNLPIDILKIAKPFLDPPAREQRNPDGLLAGIVGFGRHLGLTTVAEGIERPDQRTLLAELGCDLGQGFLLGPPLDAAGASALLAAERAGARPLTSRPKLRGGPTGERPVRGASHAARGGRRSRGPVDPS
jgi:diguanylate cyclase (GGDEF)-like protein